jgi:serine/threonine protein kinase
MEYDLKEKFCSNDGAVLTATEQGNSLEGRIIANGRYHVLRALGEGGMGQVFLAMQIAMEREVALKVMRPQLASDAKAVERFYREARNASKVSHPNVAQVIEFGPAEDGLLFMAMEYIQGESLSAELTRTPILQPMRVVDIVRQVADGLQAVHDAGITHRDLKPDNIMLRRNRAGGEIVKVVDFGIAKIDADQAQHVTTTGVVIGTPAYMSPEQLRGLTADHRSDVYSLGLVAFKMLTGAQPFAEITGLESIASRLTDQPRRLADANQGRNWGAELEGVIARVLANDLDARYQNATEFARELEKAVRALPEMSTANDATVILDATAVTANVGTPRWRIPAIAAGVLVAVAGGAYAFRTNDVVMPSGPTAAATPSGGHPSKAPASVPPSAGAAAATVTPAGHVVALPSKDSTPTKTAAGNPSFAIAVPAFRVRVAGLSPSLRASVASAARSVSGVKLVDDASTSANLVVQANEDGTVSVNGPRGEPRLSKVVAGVLGDVLVPVIRHDAYAQELAALDVPDAQRGLDLRFANDKQSYALDDEVQMRLQSDRGGYLTLVDLSPDGVVTVLHPSKTLDLGPVKANTLFLVPGPSNATVFRAGLPLGTELMRAIITDAPLAIQRGGKEYASSTDDPALVGNIRRAIERMVRAGGAHWSTRAIPYTIHR